MKATLNDRIKLIDAIRSEFRNADIPKDTEGVILEVYTDPEMYCIDLRIPDDSLVGGARWENVILKPGQFEVLTRSNRSNW